jgi:hypothetical protein
VLPEPTGTVVSGEQMLVLLAVEARITCQLRTSTTLP